MPLIQLNRFKRRRIPLWPFRVPLHFPKGLHGFEKLRQFILVGYETEVPLLWLKAEEDTISFIVMDPFLRAPNYDPVIAKSDLEVFKEKEGDVSLFLLSIVNTQSDPYTINLGAPLLIHWQRQEGLQILVNDKIRSPIYP